MTQRLRDLFASVFGIPTAGLTDDDSPATIPQWDSLSHISLMLAIEAEFGVQLAAEDFAALRSIAAIRSRLSEAGVDA